MSDHTHAGFRERIRLAEARERLRELVVAHDRTERVDLVDADGRVLADSIAAPRAVPHYDRAAMDGFAVRAEDTFGASDRSPGVLRRIDDGAGSDGGAGSDSGAGSDGRLAPGQAAPVHTGSALPAGADAVVMVEHTESVGGDLEVFDAVPEGENVAPVGEDVEDGQPLFSAGHRLRPSDLGLLKSTGVSEVRVRARPSVGVIPTGEELVQADPDPGEVIETNGMTVAQLVARWGGEPAYRDVVTDDEDALADAIERDLERDLVVTTGGSSVGERDLLPDVVSSMGEVVFHGVALRPGHPVALGVVEDTPVLMLPGYPVSTLVNAVQLLRPAVKWAGGMPLSDLPTTEARLGRKVRSEPGVRTFARVHVEERDGDRVAVPTRTSGAGVLSSVALADGWVVVPESREGIPTGETVAVEDWEWSA